MISKGDFLPGFPIGNFSWYQHVTWDYLLSWRTPSSVYNMFWLTHENPYKQADNVYAHPMLQFIIRVSEIFQLHATNFMNDFLFSSLIKNNLISCLAWFENLIPKLMFAVKRKLKNNEVSCTFDLRDQNNCCIKNMEHCFNTELDCNSSKFRKRYQIESEPRAVISCFIWMNSRNFKTLTTIIRLTLSCEFFAKSHRVWKCISDFSCKRSREFNNQLCNERQLL